MEKKQIEINVRNKVACLVDEEQFLVCGNDDYEVVFHFDEEWNDINAKTALFVYGERAVPVPFIGNVCGGVIIDNSTVCAIGVFAGDLKTTTGAGLRCLLSIRDNNNAIPEPPEPQVYDRIMEMLDEAIQSHTELPAGGKKGQVLKKKSDEDYDTQWEDENAIIDVESLPTSDINEKVLYRVRADKAYTLYNQPFQPEAPNDTYIFDAIIADTLPKVGIPSVMFPWSSHYTLYYQKSDKKLYMYVSEEEGDLNQFFSAGWNIADVSAPLYLVNSEPEEIKDHTVYFVYKEKSITKLYYYLDGWHEVGENTEIPTEIYLKSSTEGSSKELGISVNDDGEISITEKKTNKVTKIVPFTTDETLSFKNNVLSVNIAQEPAPDNTLPISAAAVATTVGNIEILLKTI